MTFEEYLIKKKIDAKLFMNNESEQYEEFASLFAQIHPNSFTFQKLNLINFIRRKYPLMEEAKPAVLPIEQSATNIPEVASEKKETPPPTTTKTEPPKSGSRPMFKRKS